MTKSREKQLKVNALELVNELSLSGDKEWFYGELKELLFTCSEEIPPEWFTFFGGTTALQSVNDVKIKKNTTESIILEFKAAFTEDYIVKSYDTDSKALREGRFMLEISKSDGRITLSIPT
ncbi:MAG: hypothetical protein ACM3P0_07505 [Acidobacteriota bacterium]